MMEKRVKFSTILENQLPSFVREDFPLVSEFLSQYYISLETQGGVYDLIQNIDQYIKIDQLTNLTEKTYLTQDVNPFDDIINVDSTAGFPDSYGLIQIDSEIITYTSKSNTQFIGCIRGFSGITSYKKSNNPDQLVFQKNSSSDHYFLTDVKNLNILFLKEFFLKLKNQFLPGFEDRSLYEDLNKTLFLNQAKNFYTTKGSDESFKLLFKILYGQECEVIKPRDYLFSPSGAEYKKTTRLIVESVVGNPLDLVNLNLRQDETYFINRAIGVVNHVEKIERDNKEFYILDLDYNVDSSYGNNFGEFSIHPKTKLTKSAAAVSSVLDVDSTIGFPNTGSLSIRLPNGTELTVSYSAKTINQFLECGGIDQAIEEGQEVFIENSSCAYGYLRTDNGREEIRVRVSGVLSNAKELTTSKFYKKGDELRIKSLGITSDDVKLNNWIFNIPITYDIDRIELIDQSSFTYRIFTVDENIFNIGDNISLISTDGSILSAKVIGLVNKDCVVISEVGNIDFGKKYRIRKNISKFNYKLDSSKNIYNSDVLNTYLDLNSNVYVASNSLPSYSEVSASNNKILFSGTFNGEEIEFFDSNGRSINHSFYSGDAIYYRSVSESNKLNISDGIYFVRRINSTTIKLAKSRSNLFVEDYIFIEGSITNNSFETYNTSGKELLPQKLVRKLTEPEQTIDKIKTKSGFIGMLVNGVEIKNYKSEDYIYYGEVEQIDVIDGGDGYNIVNTPTLSILDSVGTGATGYCAVEGSLSRIDILNPGFDYIEEPSISIKGGNGQGAIAKANLVEFDYFVSFLAEEKSSMVDLSNNIITFPSYHKLRDGENVIYDTEGQTPIGGLKNGSSYYVSVIDPFRVKLHNTFEDASVGINAVNLTSYGAGYHNLNCSVSKKKIGSIEILNSGSGYKNNKIVLSNAGINTFSNTIEAKNHGYVSGDIIQYTSSTPISGLENLKNYYVTKVDDDKFRLSLVGLGTTSEDFYYKTNQYIDLTSAPIGQHQFSHQPISIEVVGKIGVSTISISGTNLDLKASLRPVFTGKIKSIYLQSGGSGYGSEDILNFEKLPSLVLSEGGNAYAYPIIVDGTIKQIIVNDSGTNFTEVPEIEIVSDTGSGAVVSPIVKNGALSEILVLNGGSNYNKDSTRISIKTTGKNCILKPRLKSWNIDLVDKLIRTNQITEDDGFISEGLNENYQLQYSHLYAPRNLRKNLSSTKIINGKKTYLQDLIIQNQKEVRSSSHSPIIGWAYDGNPIYGPYAYSNANGTGPIREMKSGYELLLNSNRPNQTIFPLGSFVEDYTFVGNGDLDKFNGRFCITPEFPNGVYAYFATVNPDSIDSDGPFTNFKRPIFPYFIGTEYHSKPIDFNFSLDSNQDDFNFNESGLLRNTSFYSLLKKNTYYDYILNTNVVLNHKSRVKYSSLGKVESVGIITGGSGYRVGDTLEFETNNTQGKRVSGLISKVKGKQIVSILTKESKSENVEFISSGPSILGICSSPHQLKNNDLISISGLNTTGYYFQEKYNIGVSSESLTLTKNVQNVNVTGVVTYFNVNGRLSSILENDIFEIDNEKIKVLSTDEVSQRIKVLRQYDNTVGAVHTAFATLVEQSRKIRITSGVSTFKSTEINREYYFDPKESVSIGTGLGTTIRFSNPGAGITQIFAPSKTIYIPNNNLLTGNKVVYKSNGGSPLSVSTDGVSNFTLTNNQILYSVISQKDFVGFATERVSIGQSGSIVGINSTQNVNTLYFSGIGTGNNHSFVTVLDNVFSGDIVNYKVTVATASSHGLEVNDSVTINSLPGITTTVSIKYNQHNRRLVARPRNFNSIDIINNSITIPNHNYYTGQKVIYTSASPSNGLIDNKIYYVLVVDSNNIKLCESYYQTQQLDPLIIDITSSTAGTISEINPQIIVKRNQVIIFDLSDSSLSDTSGFDTFSAFDLEFYSDSNFSNKFTSSKSSKQFEIIKYGNVGIDTNARVELVVTDTIPNDLYYKLTPINLDILSENKKDVLVDDEFISSNSNIKIEDSVYTGTYNVVGVGSTTFEFNLNNKPEKFNYSSSEGTFEYTTTSNANGVLGGIASVDLNFNSNNYSNLPTIENIISNEGEGALLYPVSNSIGKVNTIEIIDNGFDYSSDLTLRPVSKLPDVLEVESLYSFDRIGISSVGRNYSIAPNLIAIDRFTNKKIDDLVLEYELGDSEVRIVQNTKGINNIKPKIVPTNNSNAIGINSITFNNTTKLVTITLSSNYSIGDQFPFSVGDKIFIENTSVGIASTSQNGEYIFIPTGRGYNSSDYDYEFFTVNSITPNYGASNPSITYTLSNFLKNGENPGVFNAQRSSGKVVPEKYLPIFDPTLKKNNYLKGEKLTIGEEKSAIVVEWDPKAEFIKVSSLDTFDVGDLVIGETSQTRSYIKNINSSSYIYDVSGSFVSENQWNTNTGFLNDNLQRIQDSDYYQNLSYSLKSTISIDNWDDPVSSILHPVGFKKFSDLVITSRDNLSVGILTSQEGGDFTSINDLDTFIDLNCYYDYDLVSENSLDIDSNTLSDRLIFSSKVLKDYSESVGNRVLSIDDFSDQFNSKERTTKYSVIDSFRLSDAKFKKYISYVIDRRFIGERQISLITLLHDNSYAYLNQYGKVYTTYDMGNFDFSIFGSDGQLLFYPEKYDRNNFEVSVISYNLRDTVLGIGTLPLGNVSLVESTTKSIGAGTSIANIVSISSTFRSTKHLISVESLDENYFELNEITLIRDGGDVYSLEYGRMNDTLSARSGSGLGTYHSYFSGSTVNIDFIPNPGLGVSFFTNVLSIELSDITNTTTGISTINSGVVRSSFVSIGSSASPSAVGLTTYSTANYSGAYFFVSIEDKTNNEYKCSELVLANNNSDCYLSEFGILQTSSSLGNFDATVSGSVVSLTFTPNPNIDVEVRLFENTIGTTDENIDQSIIDFDTAYIDTNFNFYNGTLNDLLRTFNLYSDTFPIFERVFDGSNANIVNLSNDVIRIPNHFFVTGEEIVYSYSGSANNAIGIATTTISGISTNKLPSTLYIIKVDDSNVKVASSATDALSSSPIALNLNAVGVGTNHKFTGKNQNQRVLISIDNTIQSPVVSTSITTTCASPILVTDDRITFTGITSFFGSDLIKVNNELMRVLSVGIGTNTNLVSVDRGWMGTTIESHPNGSLIVKVSGNYNIVNNQISFAEAPYGKTPFSSTTNPPSERDFSGITTFSTFSGRVFLRSGVQNTTKSPYDYNYPIDDISSQFNGIQTSFTLTSNKVNLTGISTGNAIILVNSIFQEPSRLTSPISVEGSYNIKENAGLSTIFFRGTNSIPPYDIQASNVPVGGLIVSVGSSAGLGYQPLVSAGGTAIVSGLGTISSISIGNSGSGYRPGVQPIVRVGVATSSVGTSNIQFIGTAIVSNGNIVSVAITNPGIGYTTSNPPIVIFDSPLSYTNIPLVYSSSSTVGVGTSATIDIVVGQGSSVIDFSIKNLGYGYGQGEILTVNIGGVAGIPTDPSKSFNEFKIFVDRTYSDSFSGWTIGDLEVLDDISGLFDGQTKVFPISYNGELKTIKAKIGSNIRIENTLLIFVNDILQIPGKSYNFSGGSYISFTEAPKFGDTCKVIFYKGTGDVDVVDIDVLESIKVGDTVTINSDNFEYQQNSRLTTLVDSTNTIKTNSYAGPGVSNDETLLRPVKWCKQTEDRIIEGKEVAKDRILYEPLIYPNTNIIQPVGLGSTFIYVENVKTFFDSVKENSTKQRDILIISQDQLVSAAATAIVSIAGTISSISITNGGIGYLSSPSITLSNPIGLGTTQRCVAISSVSSKSVSSISVVSGGIGYTSTNPPNVLIEPPISVYEQNKINSYIGDFGEIVGFGTTTIASKNKFILDLNINPNSILRNTTIVSTAITVSSLSVGDYFVVKESNIGIATTSITSLRIDGSVIGIGTQFIDNVYQVSSSSIITTTIPGIGATYINRIYVDVLDFNSSSFASPNIVYSAGISTSSFFGSFSWGKLILSPRPNPEEFNFYGLNGISGISTSAIVKRIHPLKYNNYL